MTNNQPNQKPEHITDMPLCWCNPRKEVHNGNMVIIHNNESETTPPQTPSREEIEEVIANLDKPVQKNGLMGRLLNSSKEEWEVKIDFNAHDLGELGQFIRVGYAKEIIRSLLVEQEEKIRKEYERNQSTTFLQ